MKFIEKVANVCKEGKDYIKKQPLGSTMDILCIVWFVADLACLISVFLY